MTTGLAQEVRVVMMRKRFAVLGGVLAVAGLGFAVAGGVAYAKVQDGYGSLQAFSEQQNVTLNYNDQGQLVDRGETAGAEAIMSLLKDDWQYPVVESDLDPDDPLVNSASEYMYQMAAVAYHTLHSTQTVVLDEAVTSESGEVFPAGEYEFDVDGRYWTDFDRSNPIEAAAREQAWTGTAHGLVAELGVGTVTHSTLQMGLALAGLFVGLGLVLMITGGGLVWASRGSTTVVPDTVPEAFVTDRIEEEDGGRPGLTASDSQPGMGPPRRAHPGVFRRVALGAARQPRVGSAGRSNPKVRAGGRVVIEHDHRRTRCSLRATRTWTSPQRG